LYDRTSSQEVKPPGFTCFSELLSFVAVALQRIFLNRFIQDKKARNK
jgi:predicted chitinase